MKNLIVTVVACLCAGLLLTLGLSQEVPLGGIKGTVTMQENGRPLSGILVVISPKTTDDRYEFQTRNFHVKTDESGAFSLTHVPAGDYRLEVAAKEHKLKSRTITVSEGGQTPLEIRLTPSDPTLQLYASQKVIAPNSKAKLEMVGFSPESQFAVSVRKLKVERIASSGSLQEALQPVALNHKPVPQKTLDDMSTPVWSGAHPIVKKDAEGSFVEPLDVPALGEGLYMVSVAGGGMSASAFLNVTKIALVTKSANHSALCFVTDIDSGKPLAGIPLSLPTGPKNEIQSVGTTDGSGLATIHLTATQSASLILAQSGNSLAVANASLAADSHNEGGDAVDPNVRIFSYADRPVYRPGDTVQFKSIVRRINGDDLKLPGTGTAKIRIMDNQDNLLQTQELPVSLHGTLHGSFNTSSEAKPGVYQVEVSAFGGKESYYVNLAAYRKPDFSVKVTAAKPRYPMGDTVESTVDCQYFFGGPVVGAKMKATIYRSPAWDFDAANDDDDTPDASVGSDASDFSGGEFVQDVEAVTDGTGKATISFPTLQSAAADSAYSDYNYSVQVAVVGSGDHTFEGSGSVLVTRGDLRLSASSDQGFLSLNESGNVVIKTTSFDKPAKPVSGQTVQVKLEEETYTAHTVVYQTLQTVSVVTDAKGEARIPVTPKQEGNIRVRALLQDAKGRTVQAESELYVDGSVSSEDTTNPTVSVKLNKKKYAVGETAKVLVSTNNPGGEALLTVESDTIKRSMLVSLDKGSALVKVPVDVSMTPNAFVSIAYICKRSFSEASHRLMVNRNEKQLSIEITPQSPKTQPGREVSFRIKTKSAAGKGVEANVSFGLVDESIYAIKRDTTDIASSLYPQKEDLVQTNFSFPEIYLDGGDKGGGSVPIRRKFQDTATWIPDIQTDKNGNASVKVKLPDNLTSWRATSVAATDDSSVGMCTSNVVASKPLMVRVIAPQFMVANDTQALAAAVTNDSGEALQVKLATACTGLNLSGDASNSFQLASGETKSIPLPISSTNSGAASIVSTVTCDKGFSDAVESKFTVLPHARLVEDSQGGMVSQSKDFTFNLLNTRDPNSGNLHVTVTPSIAGGLVQSLDQLVQFPYGCVEQTLSRFLPAVRVVQLIHNTPLRSQTLETRADKIAVDGFARLQKMQHSDGGWGWWNYDDSDPFMTAWVLDGLLTAKSCGKTAPLTIDTGKALQWAEARVKKTFVDESPDAKLFLLFALTEYGKGADGAAILRTTDWSKVRIGRLALGALAANKLHETAVENDCLDRLILAIKTDSVPGYEPGAWWSDDEEYALALRALVTLRPQDGVIPGLAMRLEKSKRWDGWISTRATTLATIALCDYIGVHPETLAPGTVTVKLNDQVVKTEQVDPAKPNIPDLQITIPVSKLVVGSNKLSVSASSTAPYVAADLRQYDVEPVLAQGVGADSLSVRRAYYRMEPTRTDDGTLRLLPTKVPITEFQSGDVIRCEVVVHCDHPVDFLLVEDPIPSNCIVTDREDPMEGDDWDWWWSDLTILDDRVAFFARRMPKGDNKLSYTIRAQGNGSSVALPTHVQDMYAPDLSASGAESKLVVAE